MTTLLITRLNFPLLAPTFQIRRPLLMTFCHSRSNRHPILSLHHRILLANHILVLVLPRPPLQIRQ